MTSGGSRVLEEIEEFRLGDVTVRVDAKTGLLAGTVAHLPAGDICQQVQSSLSLELGGTERRSPFGGLEIDDAQVLDHPVLSSTQLTPGARALRVETLVGELVVGWLYKVEAAATGPALRVDIDLSLPPTPADVWSLAPEVLIRDLTWTVMLPSEDAGLVAAPGNRLRPGITLQELTDTVAVNTAGGTPGSTGLVAISGASQCFVVWPLSKAAIGLTSLWREGKSLVVQVETGLAAAVGPENSATWGPLWLLQSASSWADVKPSIPAVGEQLGLSVPQDSPEWTHAPSIIEVQLGTSRFGGPADYSPYPDVAALRADLPRLVSLGFDTVQIMPRQPFPSYNVADWFDIEKSYGDEARLAEFVADAHARGIRVILDVLMHGVLDREFLSEATDAIRSGPHGNFLTTNAHYAFEDTLDLARPDQVPWSQHLLDFEADWLESSPEVHPVFLEHPEWFFQDSAGETSGIYTRAFELGNPQWQEYLLRALRSLIDRLDVDGFRFDAPTYNAFPNWSEETRKQASASELACLGLFERLREELKPERPNLMFYTEPSGVFLRASMDLVYNYDEHAQLEDLMGYGGVALGGVGRSTAGIRNARELMAWFEERAACLPPDSVTAHHIDSHDTFWWPRPGQKWRREQFGIDSTRALASIFALTGGPYMTFVGGEQGIERHLAAVHRLRATPLFYWGEANYDSFGVEPEQIYAVERRLGDERALVLVNVGDVTVTARVRGRTPAGRTDLLLGVDLAPAETSDGFELELGPWATAVLTVNTADKA